MEIGSDKTKVTTNTKNDFKDEAKTLELEAFEERFKTEILFRIAQ